MREAPCSLIASHLRRPAMILVLLAVVLVAVPALGGCSEQTVKGGDVAAPKKTTTSGEPAASADSTQGGDWVGDLNSVPDEEPAAVDPKDDAGRTPEVVVKEYFAALKSGNLKAAYAIVAPAGRPAFQTWQTDVANANGVVVSYELGRARVPRESSAVVDVTYSLKDPASGVVTTHEHEWWQVVRVKGLWLMPVTSGQ